MTKRRMVVPLSKAAEEPIFHGGIVTSSGPYGEDDAEQARAKAVADAFAESIERGMEALRNGTSPFAPDVEPVPNSAIETFDIFDVGTGQHHVIWRVACRERSKHAN